VVLDVRKSNLIITAHPDDETLFFGGLVLTKRTRSWANICITDGNADGRSKVRLKEYQAACNQLGFTQVEAWKFPDIYEKDLDVLGLVARLRRLPTPKAVYTHGPLGEYGRPHHQQVCFAVFEAFWGRCPIWTPAYNAYPELRVNLTPQTFNKNMTVLTRIYGLETSRFLHLLPCTSTEGFVRPSQAEVMAWRSLLEKGRLQNPASMKIWSALRHPRVRPPKGRRPRPF